MRRANLRLRITPFIGAVLAALLAGCSGPTPVPVGGKVVWSDGTAATELAGGAVEFESADGRTSARGEIAADATFVLGTNKPREGVLPGEYRVVVIPPPPVTERPVYIIDRRFLKYDTSGLTFTVQTPTNEGVVFTVARAKKK